MEKHEPSVCVFPSEVVTVRSLAPTAASAVTVRFAVMVLSVMDVVEAVTPVPDNETAEPFVKRNPEIVAAMESP